jgi:GNAT superfamily N-acetyltransferase
MQDLAGKDAAKLRIRAAYADEATLLRKIAIAAKSYWGYDQAWVTEWVESGGFSDEALRARDIYVADFDGHVVGWASSVPKGAIFWLDDLWVDPVWIGKGIGSRLWRHVAGVATAKGAVHLEWEAEPNAIGFYEKMGGRYLRDSESNEWGRVLPIMGVMLQASEPA